MSATSDYMAQVKARGWVYLDQLPFNTPLGRNVEGAPGARSPWSPNGSQYELAPLAVRIEQGFLRPLQKAADAAALNDLAMVEARDSAFAAVKDSLAKAAEKTGLDHGLFGVLAKALGVPVWFLLLLLLLALCFALYALLAAVGAAPSLKKVVA